MIHSFTIDQVILYLGLSIMENNNYSFSLRIDNAEFSVGGDKEFVESNIKKWLSLFKDKLPQELLGEETHKEDHHQPHGHRGKISITDFIKTKSPKTFDDLVITILFYYEKYEGFENIGVSPVQVKSFLDKLSSKPTDEEFVAIFEKLSNDKFIELMAGSEMNPKYQVTFPGEQLVKTGFNI